MSSSSSSPPPPPPVLPPTPTPYSQPQKLRRKRSKLIKLDPGFLLPGPNPNPNPNPNANASSSSHHHHQKQHSFALSKQFGRRFDTGQEKFRHCCPECFKQFGSEKALYGHMRCHPDRDYRGMTRKPVRFHRVSNAVSTSSSSLIHEESTAAPVVMTMEDHEVASCLLMLSRTEILETETHMEIDFGGGNECDGGATGGGGGASCSFECSSCKKVFGSHQALGGHRASHKNVKGCFAINRSCGVFSDQVEEYDDQNCSTDTEIKDMAMVLGHKCSICSRVFPTGQALGGHKRCHWEKGDDQNNVQGHNGNFVVLGGKESSGLDLNLPAPRSVDDDDDNYDQSCSSYNSSHFNLDLRLGL
ncbi:C2H2-like zinc finger protein [Euphorbia peplus]|nr:C2H2-like zinc finger protein [Euphorbia peplus]